MPILKGLSRQNAVSEGFPRSCVGRFTFGWIHPLGGTGIEVRPKVQETDNTTDMCYAMVVTNERGKVTVNDFDNDGHLTGITDAEGNHTTITWDNGLPETAVNARGETTTWQYDNYRRLSVEIKCQRGPDDAHL